MASTGVTSRGKTLTMSAHADTTQLEIPRSIAQDDLDLIRIGKRPVLKRNFGFMSILGFSCTVLITWEGILLIFTQSLMNGGPAGVIWGFLIIWCGTISVFLTIAELASMAPTAAGQYHWVAMLAPAKWQNFLSYLTAWITIAGWQAVTASAAYLIGTLIQSLAALMHPDYSPRAYQSMLFLWAIVLVAVFINTVASKALARFEGVILLLHLFGFIAVLVPLVYFGPHGSASIFTDFRNHGNWSTQTLSFFVGLPGAVFSLIGADSAVHMSEEIQNAAVVVPRAIILSILVNGTLGFAIVLATLFCMGDTESALDDQQTYGFAIIGIFLQATGSATGACLMGVVITILGVCSTVGALAASARMMWSFARDGGLPFSAFFSFLDPRTSIPVVTIAATTLISVLLSLIILGSAIAFNDILSLTIVGLYTSYFLATSLLLYRRIAGHMAPYDSDTPCMNRSGDLHWGRWRIPEPAGTINNTFACIYLLLVAFWSLWPPATPVDPSTMNYAILVFGTIVLFSVAWWFFRARRSFRGPLVEIALEQNILKAINARRGSGTTFQ